VVLATDGSATYTLVLYSDIQWRFGSTNIGFNAGDGIHGFNLQFSTVFKLVDSTNVGIPGTFFFRVDQDTIQQPELSGGI